ncbi:glycosyltransferase [Ruegeria conchae]|nr:glycosyltransferase [Ruegeria conchae]
MTELNRERRYSEALVLCRQICQSSFARPQDHFQRTKILHALGKGAVVKRYVDWLYTLFDRQQISRADLAFRLWKSWRPKSAMDVLGERQNWQTNATAERSALLSLVDLRRYIEARELNSDLKHVRQSSRLNKRINTALNALSAEGISAEAEEDIAFSVLRHWVKCQKEQPTQPYKAHAGRVLLYNHSLGIGGAERQVTHLIANLAQDPLVSSLHMLTKEQPKNVYKLPSGYSKLSNHQFDDMPVSLPDPWKDEPTLQSVASLSEAIGMRWLRAALGTLYELRPEVVHIRGGLHAELALAAVISGTPRVVVHFGSMTRGQQSSGSEIESLRERLSEYTIKLCAGFPQVVLAANSRAAANDWAQATGLPDTRFTTIYNAIEPKELGFEELSPPNPDSGQQLTVGGVFRFSPVKDPLLWVSVAKRVNTAIPGTRFLMVGDGPLRKDIEKAIASAGLTDQFVLPGLVSEGLFDYLRQMDLFLMTTCTESLPNAVIEAQLAGLPVVAPDVGGINEAIADHDTARLTMRSADALAQAVIDGLQNEDWRASVHARSPGLILNKFSRAAQLNAVKTAYGWC